jgi:hypothetical protein
LRKTHGYARCAEDCLKKILARLELPDIRSVAPIQTDEQIGGDIAWLHTHEAGQALKVMHEVIATAWRQTKDVHEVKPSIRARYMLPR